MIVGYPMPGKDKATLLLEAFCIPAGGRVMNNVPDRLAPGAAAFYGVTPALKHLWEQAKAEKRDWYYIDNAYFDACRQVYFRITRNSLQCSSVHPSDGKRFAALGISVAPWGYMGRGEHVLVCPQSDEFMRTCAGYRGSWLEDVLRELSGNTKRELRVRPWNRNKEKWYASLPSDLANCHALVTYSSASAMSALLAGVPAFTTAADCVTSFYTGESLALIDSPRTDINRAALFNVAADNQWTVAEMRSGAAWAAVGR